MTSRSAAQVDRASSLWPAVVVAGIGLIAYTDWRAVTNDVIREEPRQELIIVVADVAGKGVAAAMLMPVVQVTVRLS